MNSSLVYLDDVRILVAMSFKYWLCSLSNKNNSEDAS